MSVDYDFIFTELGIKCEFTINGVLMDSWDVKQYTEEERERAHQHALINFYDWHARYDAMPHESIFPHILKNRLTI